MTQRHPFACLTKNLLSAFVPPRCPALHGAQATWGCCHALSALPLPPVLQLTGNVGFAGGLVDPVAALLLCTPGYVDVSVVNGEVVVEGGKLITCDLEALVQDHNERAVRICGAVGSPDL